MNGFDSNFDRGSLKIELVNDDSRLLLVATSQKYQAHVKDPSKILN